MTRRLLMFLLGIIVGLVIGHAIGYRHAQMNDREEMWMMRQILKTVPRANQ